ncbi:MAG: hypothetical protein RMM29_08430, partial [Planctomycetota bacterium]|nr:hypothetical protein [Planctomycetota bacterium]
AAVCRRLKLPAPAIYHLLLEDRDSPEQVILGGASISDLTAKLEKLGRKFPRWIVILMEIDKDGWWIPITPPKIWERKFDIKSTRK